MRFLPHIVAVIALTCAGLFLYKLGQSNATVTCEQGKTTQAVGLAKQTVKATVQRDRIDHETRKLPDTAVDAELSRGGWLRD